MISPKEAIEKILQRGKLAEVKAVDLDDALGYVLAEDVVSNVNVPPFNNSAMDGFAMHSADLRKTGPLKIIGEVQAGQEAKILVKEGAVISIMTGAALPEKTNAVIPVENVEASESEITVKKAVEKSANIRRAGEDIKKGSTIIKAGMVLKPINIGLAASVGVAELKVYGKPKVVIVVTGDELIKPGQDLKPGQIYESNSFFLKGLLKKLEADVVYSAKAKDTLEDTIDKLSMALSKADVVLTTGGISVGKYDFVAKALEKIGAKQIFDKVSQKPGKPLSLFTYDDKTVVSLPGNPVAVGICFELYIRPLLLKMGGHKDIFRKSFKAITEKPIRKKKGRTSYIRVRVARKKDNLYAQTTGAQGSGVLTSMLADGIAELPADVDEIKKGQKLTVVSLGDDYK